ncbi:hypothetical protein LUZ60_001259 [Juncus effusus]|nr:hypothetical protein LUZ60_001259 [Juncus effusus]
MQLHIFSLSFYIYIHSQLQELSSKSTQKLTPSFPRHKTHTQKHNFTKHITTNPILPTLTTMACINMFNTDHQAALGPRISFSNDFSVEPPAQPNRSQRLAVTDPDFEFSVGSHNMIAADQIFSKGRIMPFKDSNHCGPHRMTTLRDELKSIDEGNERASKGSSLRWKEFLGLGTKAHKNGAPMPETAEARKNNEMQFMHFRSNDDVKNI